MCRHLQGLEDSIGAPGAGVSDNCKLPNLSAWKQILILCKSIKNIKPHSHLFSPHKYIFNLKKPPRIDLEPPCAHMCR